MKLEKDYIRTICIVLTNICIVSSFSTGFSTDRVIQYTIFEELPVGTVVGQLPSTDRSLSPSAYQLSHSTYSQYFTVSDNRLLVAKNMDRDKICPQNMVTECLLSLTLVEPSGSVSVIRVDVILKDINDNAPVFSSEQIVLEVSESAPIGTQLYLPTAVDADDRSYGVQTYRFIHNRHETDIQAFTLVQSRDSYDDADVNPQSLVIHLVVSTELDREHADRYHGWLIAIDGGEPAKSGKLEVVIEITDSNDNAPKFDRSSYSISVPEDLEAGSIVLNVTATDADEGENARIIYNLAKQPGHDGPFNVDPNTGAVYLVRNLDYEKQTSHSLVISARDSGPGSIPAYTRATIQVTDTNDNYPHISLGDAQIKIPENKESNLFVAQFSVEDKDKGENGIVNCWLEDESASAFELKQHHSSMLVLVSRISFDRETQSSYEVKITCKDKGWPSHESSEVIVVQIEDENDNPPLFSSSMYVCNALESLVSGSNLLQVEATDADAGRNAEINYKMKVVQVDLNPNYQLKRGSKTSTNEKSLSFDSFDDSDKSQDEDPQFIVDDSEASNVPQSDGWTNEMRQINSEVEKWFHINERTGLITVGQPLDFECARKVYLQVSAHDNGSPTAQSSATKAVINILDVNDEPPKFSRQAYSFGVLENLPAGTEIGHVSASDLDSSPYNQFRFSLVEPRSIHHHHQHYHQHRHTPLSNVLENNFRDTEIGLSHTASTAHVPDARLALGLESTVSNYATALEAQDWFSIDPITGKITTVRPLDREHHSVHRFWVSAVDLNHPFFVTSAEVTVNVADRNDNAPRILFPNQLYLFHIPVAAHKDYVVARILASDADVGENAHLLYSIAKGNDDDIFAINSFNGEITVAKEDAFTSRTSPSEGSNIDVTHRLLILVKDNGQPEKVAVVNIEVCVNKSLQLSSSHSSIESEAEGYSSIFSWSDLDLTTFTGKYLVCLIITVSFILVLVIIVLAVFTRRMCLRRKRKQTLVTLKKSNFNNDQPKSSTSFTILPKNSNINYSSVNHIGKTSVPETLDRSSPYFKSIDISNDLNYVPSENYYSPRLATMKMNGTSTFQRSLKTTCHEDAVLHISDKDGYILVKEPVQDDITWVKNHRMNSGGTQEVNRLLEMLKSERLDTSTSSSQATLNDQPSTFRVQKTTI